ncbi:hypothetical protein C1N91_14215 [Curtobacterium sp. SGAir0471]|nr:hypothetical protein C1N91_14215 [Curtobacterium sp. SGAir0471]
MTPETDQLVGTWTRADDAAPVVPPVRPASSPDAATDADTGPDGSADGSAVRPGGTARRSRRVTTQPVPGSDPSPAPEPARHRDGENDAQLLRDVPPHW